MSEQSIGADGVPAPQPLTRVASMAATDTYFPNAHIFFQFMVTPSVSGNSGQNGALQTKGYLPSTFTSGVFINFVNKITILIKTPYLSGLINYFKVLDCKVQNRLYHNQITITPTHHPTYVRW
jgi:hypothetical protein